MSEIKTIHFNIISTVQIQFVQKLLIITSKQINLNDDI